MISNNEIPEPPPSFWDSYLSTALNKDVSKLPKSTNIENPISMFLSIPIKRNYQPASGDINPLNATLKSLSSLPVGKLMKMGKSDTTSGAGISSTPQKDISGVNLFGKSKDVVPGFLNYKDVLVPWLTKSQQSSGQNYLETQQVSTLDATRIENINILSKYELLMPSDAQWYALNQLRIHAGAPEKSEKGIDKLMEYYAQLLFLESKFPFETEEVQSSFTWYEAFNATRKVTTNCIQYEKAAVLFNIGAIYSQLAANQKVWTPDGIKVASQFFQKSAGVFVLVKDILVPRFRVKVDKSADLSEATLSAISELLLAQAHECFVEKANLDKTSSPVTSTIAAQTADHYELAYRSAKNNTSFGKSRFAKEWVSCIRAKSLLYTAVAHFHAPKTMIGEVSIGERIARLMVAKTLIDKATKEAEDVGGTIQSLVQFYAATVTSKLHETDSINHANFHQSILDPRLLSPLKRLQHSLVSPTAFPNVLDIQTDDGKPKYSDIFDNIIFDREAKKEWECYWDSLKLVIEKGSEDCRNIESEIDSKLLGLDLQSTESVEIAPLSTDSVQSANQIVEQIKLYQKEESVMRSEDMLHYLTQLHQAIEANATESQYILDNVDITTFPSDPTVFTTITSLRSSLTNFVDSFKDRRSRFKDLYHLFETEIADFSPLHWTQEKLVALIPSLDPSFTNASIDPKVVVKERSYFVGKLEKLKEDVKEVMKEVEELRKGKIALSELDEFKRNKNVDALKKSKELVRNIEEKIEGYLKEKNDILSKIMDLTRQLETGRKINREYEDSLKIVAAFQNTFKHYISFREGAQNELDRCMRIREESISILQKCQNLPFRRPPSNGNQASYQTNPTAPDTYIAERDLSAGDDNLQRFGPASSLSDTPNHYQNSNFISNIKLPMRYEAKESQTNGGSRLEELKEKLVSAQVSPWDNVQKQEHHMSAEMSAWSNLIKRFAVLSSNDEQAQNFPIATANDEVVFTYTEDRPIQEPIAAAQDPTVSNIYPKIPSMKQRSNSISRKPVAVSIEPTIPSLTNKPSPAAVNHASTSNPPSPTKLLQQSLSDQVTKLKSQITEGVPTLKNVVQKMMARKQAENTFGTSTTVNIAFQNTEVSEKVATPPSSPTKTSARLYQPTSVNKSAEDKLLPATSSDNLYYNLLKENRTLRSQLESLEAQAAPSRRDREYLLQLELLKQQEKRLNKLEKTIVSKNVGKSPAKETVQRALEVEKQSVSTASKEEVIEKWANEQAMLIRLRQQNFGVSSDEKGKEQVHLQMSPRREKQRRRAQEQLEEEKPQEVSSQLTLEALGSTALDTTKTESGKKKNMIKGDSGLGSSGLMEGEEEQARATSELRRARRERERERERKMKRIAGSVPPRSPSPHETTLNRLKAANDKFAEHFVQSVASETAASSATESSSHVEGLGRKSRRSKSQNDAKSRSKSRTKDRGRERDNKERDHEFSLDGSIGVGSGIGMSKRTGAVDLGFGSYVP